MSAGLGRAATRHIAQSRPDLAVVMLWHPFFALSLGTVTRRLADAGVLAILPAGWLPSGPRSCHTG